MVRTVVACSIVVLVAITAGCKMCAHPFDDCGPTFTGECGQTCDPMARAGSRLSPPLEPMAGPMVGSDEVVVPTDDAAAPGIGVPGDAPQPTPTRTTSPSPRGWTARTPQPMR